MLGPYIQDGEGIEYPVRRITAVKALSHPPHHIAHQQSNTDSLTFSGGEDVFHDQTDSSEGQHNHA